MALDRWRVPTLAECKPGIEPTEFKVLVAMTEAQEMTKGGIMLPEQVKEREQFRAACGLLVAVSPHAFTYADSWPEGSRPQVGDEVFTGHFPGDEVEGADGRTYRLCTDREIKAVLKRASVGKPIPLVIDLEALSAEAKAACEDTTDDPHYIAQRGISDEFSLGFHLDEDPATNQRRAEMTVRAMSQNAHIHRATHGPWAWVEPPIFTYARDGKAIEGRCVVKTIKTLEAVNG